MSKVIRLRLSEEDYDLITRTAKISGKGISTFCREMLLQSIKQEMKETAMLAKLLQKLESLQEPAQQNNIVFDTRLSDEIERKTQAIFELITTFAEFFFIDKTKLQNFMENAEQIKEKFFK